MSVTHHSSIGANRFSFRKCERMVSHRLIDTLFGGGSSQSVAAFPLRAVYRLCERQPADAPVQLLISVPKKRFRHAVDRNRVKRQLREAFRIHREQLYQALPDNQRLLLAFVWLSDEHCSSHEVERRVVSLIRRISDRL